MKKRLMPVLLILAMALTLLPVLPVSAAPAAPANANFVESVGIRYASSFEMIFVEGGTFTLGWTGPEGEGPPSTEPVEGVTVSDFYLSSIELTNDLYQAVMGGAQPAATTRNRPYTGSTWYGYQVFLGRLYVLTGKEYRMPTEAEWEFAAKGGNPGLLAGHHEFLYSGSNIQSEVAHFGTTSTTNVGSYQPNILGFYDMSGNVEELCWNAWSSWHVGGTDPIGIASNVHAQKTRRGGPHAGEDFTRYQTARQIRSIDGSDGYLGLRIALSADWTSIPAGTVKSRDVRHPVMDDRQIPNTYRDPRWVTGDDEILEGDFVGIFGGAAMKLWDTGEVILRPRNDNADVRADPDDIIGQWYTVNNIVLVIVLEDDNINETNGERIMISYIWMDPDMVATQNDRLGRFMAPTGRLERRNEANFIQELLTATGEMRFAQWGQEFEPLAKPVLDQAIVATADIAPGVLATANQQQYNMQNLVAADHGQDNRLLDGPNHGWWMGYGAGGEHTYRKDYDPAQARFVVYSPAFTFFPGNTSVLFRGTWFTVNNMLLVVQGTGQARQHYTYFLVDEARYIAAGYADGYEDQDVKNEYPHRHLTWVDSEKADSRLFFLEKNENVLKSPDGQGMDHNFETATSTSPSMLGTTSFMVAPAAPPNCPGIPRSPRVNQANAAGAIWCYVPGSTTVRANVQTCTCPVFDLIEQTHYPTGHIIAEGPADVEIVDGATATYTLSTGSLPNDINILNFTLSYDSNFLVPDSYAIAAGFMTAGGTFNTPTGPALDWKPGANGIWTVDLDLVLPAPNGTFSNGVAFEITFKLAAGVLGGTATTVDFSNFWVVEANRGGRIYPQEFTTVETAFSAPFNKYDLDKDGSVDWVDISLILDYFLTKAGDQFWPVAKSFDVNGDGVIDLEDLVLVRTNFS